MIYDECLDKVNIKSLIIEIRLEKEKSRFENIESSLKNYHSGISISVLKKCVSFLQSAFLFFGKMLRLEDLVNRNVQQTVELNHWKKMCEEYSEESDRLEIECDVWRTKFLASR